MCTMFTRALLTNQVTTHNDKLPDDVLFEIFDAYRQIYILQPDYENRWNSRNGWFKLAHVCLCWRRAVFSAPSHLHLCLLFTPRRSSREPVLSCLRRFPILVDYLSAEFWTKNEETLALAAIEHRGRVRRIALRKPFPDTLLGALCYPFSELESLTISPHVPGHGYELVLPPTFLSGSAPCLRQLTLRDIALRCLSSLLSSATGLTELALTFQVARSGPPLEVSLITNLQRMSCLRRLELKFYFIQLPIAMRPICPPLLVPASVVPLSNLTDFIFVGPSSYLQMLMDGGLVPPSLRHLDAEVCDTPPLSPIPHLCKFICDSGCQFIAVRLDILQEGKLRFLFFADTWKPFRITIPTPVSLEEIGNFLSEALSTVEEFVIGWGLVSMSLTHDFQWREFFNHIPRVKMVQVPSQLALDVAHSFQLHGQEPALDLLPALEQVKAYLPIGTNRLGDRPLATVRDAFEPLITARKQVGRPIVFSWE